MESVNKVSKNKFIKGKNISTYLKQFHRLPMRYGLSGASVVTFGNNIFISGGVGAGGILKAVRRILVFDHKANLWYMGPPMKEVTINIFLNSNI